MKKVLVTGAAGMIGVNVIKYLLSEGKYEITVLDLRNRTSIQNLKRYRKRVNVILGDVCNRVLMEALVKDHDIIIHLAGVMPPLADMKEDLANTINFVGAENIIRAISYYNPECHLFYASSMTLYNGNKDVTVNSKITLDEFSYYNKSLLETEKLIKNKVKNYTIYRLPFVLGNPIKDPFPLNGHKDETMEYITKEDAAYAFVKGIAFKEDLNRQTYNVTGESSILYASLLLKFLEIYGLSWKYVLNRLFIEKNYYHATCKDGDELNNIINYRNDTLSEYYNRLRSRCKKRGFQKFIAKPFTNSLKYYVAKLD